jgi:hypothetical protein
VTDRRSFESLGEWVAEFRKYSLADADVPLPIVVLGNKACAVHTYMHKYRSWLTAALLSLRLHAHGMCAINITGL